MIPAGARPAARVLIVDADRRLLLLEAHDSAGHVWWIAPGGGLEPGETFEDAARREVEEETGIVVDVGPCVWTRHHQFMFEGRPHDQYERFFICTIVEQRATASRPDSYVRSMRWWSADEIVSSSAEFAPRRLAVLLPDIIAGRYPRAPIDCGV